MHLALKKKKKKESLLGPPLNVLNQSQAYPEALTLRTRILLVNLYIRYTLQPLLGSSPSPLLSMYFIQ